MARPSRIGRPRAFTEPPSSLRESATSGGRWGLIRGVSLQLATTATTIVLARILLPADFGAIAAALVIVGLFDLLTQGGLGSSLVRRDTLNHRETSTIFWLALAIGVLASGLTAGLAGPLAGLIGQPDAALLVAVLSVTIPFSLVRNIGRSLLLREMRFRSLALIEIASTGLYSAAAVTLAFLGLGPWAIVFGYIVRGGFAAVSLLVAGGWIPTFVFDRQFLKGELAFSGGILGQQLLNYLQKNLDYWVVGAVLGAASLGAYYVAFVIPELIRRRLSDVAREVLYPVLARIGVNSERARAAYLNVVRSIAFVSFPAMIGLAVLADLAVEVAFGDRWTTAAAPMAVLALASAVISITAPSMVVTAAEGRPHLILPAQLIGVATLAVGLLVTFPSGDLATMSWAVVGGALVTALGLQVISGKLMGLSQLAFFIELVPILFAAGVMAVVLVGVRDYVELVLPPVGASIVLIVIGVGSYFAAYWVSFRSQLREQLKSLRMVILPQSTVS